MVKQVFINILILCANVFQGIWASSKGNDTLSDILIRKKRIVDYSPHAMQVHSINIVPYVVKITKYGELQCGGSILSENVIITAGDCVHECLLDIFHVISHSTTIDFGNIHNITSIILRDGYVEEHSANNLALLVIEPPIDLFFSFHKKIPIHNTWLPRTRKGFFSGWGCSEVYENTGCFTDQLRQAMVPILNKQECTALYSHIANISTVEICTFDKNYVKFSCSDDKGGPLVVDNQLLGVMSWMENIPSGPGPDVFVNVATDYHKKWIQLFVPV